MRGYLPRDTPRVLYFSYTQARRCFKCYIVLAGHVWLGVIFCSTQTAAIFGDKDISKCSYNLILVVERTNRISLAVLAIYNVTHVINCTVLVELCLKASRSDDQ